MRGEGRLHVMNSSHEKAREDLWGEPMDVKEAVGRLHVMNSSHELHVMNSSHELHVINSSHEAVGRLHVMNSSHELHVMNSSHELHVINSSHEWHVMNSSHEKAPEDLWGEPMDVVKGRVGLLVTLPLPWVGGSCDGGDEGEETLQSLPRWIMAWGESV
jgi:hypothetical protein